MSPGRRTFPWVARQILHRPPRQGHTSVVAVDGGSGAGKTTFAASLADALDTPAVHTDDVAWWEDFFDWTHLLVDGVLVPVADRRHVRHRPPAWDR